MENKKVSRKARILVDKIMLDNKINDRMIDIKNYDDELFEHSINVAY